MSGNLFLSIDFGDTPSTDTGARPYTGSTPLWENASIWLDGGPSQTQTRVGTPTTVKVRVSNDGHATIPNVQIDAYVMNPFVGLGSPSLAVQQLGGFLSSVAAGSGSTSATDAHVATCFVQDPTLGPIPWTPTQAELNQTQNAGGHLCLIANAYSIAPGVIDGGAVVGAGTFNVGGDQHQGQRNIALLPAAPTPHLGPPLGFIAVPSGERETTIAVEPVRAAGRLPVAEALGASERWLLRSHRDFSYVRLTDDGPPQLVVARHGDEEPVPIRFSERELKAVLTIGDEPPGTQARLGGQPAGAPPLGVPASVHVDLRHEDVGAMHVFDIVQRDSAGRPLGGLRVLAVAVR